MPFQTFQVILTPISFGLLFGLMLLYWGQAALFSYTKYSKLTTTLFFSCIISLTLLLICRSLDSGHLPMSNLYESLLFLSWSFLIIQFFLQMPLPNQRLSNERSSNKNVEAKLLVETLLSKRSFLQELRYGNHLHGQDQFIHFLGVLTSPMSLLTYSFAFLNLPKEMQKTTALVPALQSNWLMMHVTVMILSYAALLCGSILSMAFLFLSFLDKRNLEDKNLIPVINTQAEQNVFDNASYSLQTLFDQNQTEFQREEKHKALTENKLNLKKNYALNKKDDFLLHQEISSSTSLSLAAKLDNYSYRVLALGFPLLTIGIVSGAVWANQAWGSYWSWDPKESWALITWLVFAIYLHARITKGWTGKKPAIIATFGFFVVWFCYLGVNLLGAGLHSYGWFSQ